jgi:hypothetical protein
MTDINKLEALAKAATSGPWYTVETPHRACGRVQLYWIDSEAGNLAENICEEEAAFIAAANPATILELIALVRLQHGALCAANTNTYFKHAVDALAAFDKWEGGE